MKLDPKYFNTFLVVVAVVAAGLIAFFTISSQQNKRIAFEKRVVQQDSLHTIRWPLVTSADTISIADFSDQWVLLQFWSDWSDEPALVHRRLVELGKDAGGHLAVISAMVGFKKEKAVSYVNEHDFSLHFVAGSRQFSDLGIPGLPAYLLFNPDHQIKYVSLGKLNESRTDSLRQLVTGRN